MKAIDQLRKEHEGIRMVLKILEEMCSRLEFGKDVEVHHLEQVIDFFRVFVDLGHYGKKERLLFPALEAAGVTKHKGLVRAMLADHDLGRRHASEMAAALDRLKSDDGKNSEYFCSHGRSYISLLADHIQKEDKVLLPMVEAHLSPARQEKLMHDFESLDREQIGPGVREEFEALLRQLSDEYLQ